MIARFHRGREILLPLGEPEGRGNLKVPPYPPPFHKWYIDDTSLFRIKYWARCARPSWNRGHGGCIPRGGMGDGIPQGDVSPKIYIHTIYIYWNIESHE